MRVIYFQTRPAPSDWLQEAEVQFLSQDTCTDYSNTEGYLFDDMACAGYTDQYTGACYVSIPTNTLAHAM